MTDHDLSRNLKNMGRLAMQVLITAGGILIALELVLRLYGNTDEDHLLFSVYFSVLGVIVFVAAGQILKAIVMRQENYYDDK
jgi:F0F1-type ATP synthase membrane subunit a